MADQTIHWLIDSTINGGYPYFEGEDHSPLLKEIPAPKPWWVWRIDPNINDGYPYIQYYNDVIEEGAIFIKYIKVVK